MVDPSPKSMMPGGASATFTMLISTQYLRYILIGAWAVGLLGVVGWQMALGWMLLTLAISSIRTFAERRMARQESATFGPFFLVSATLATCGWAIAPIMAWMSGHPFGHAAAMIFISVGGFMVFSQLRSSALNATIIASPYGLVALGMLVDLWGRPEFSAALTALIMGAFCLSVPSLVAKAADSRIAAFQNDQARLIAELSAAKDKAEEANRAKSTFLAMISHELRTPLNGVLGAAQLLSTTDLNPVQSDYIKIIRHSGDGLMHLLNDILDTTRIEAGKIQMEMSETEPAQLIQILESTFSAQAAQKGLTLRIEMGPDIPHKVLADRKRVLQVLSNLMSNAVKFTHQGEITLNLTAEKRGPTQCALSFQVADTGIGIARNHLERVFEAFEQSDDSVTRQYGGSGLGLTLSRKLSRLMGGDLSVTSELGEGSVFTLSLDLTVTVWKKTASLVLADTEAEAGNDKSMRVLVVEDHPVNRKILESWLVAQGHTVTAAENGEIALELCNQQGFDVILMDVNMPVMDGLTATRLLRVSRCQNSQTPIVIVSASARSEDHDAGRAAGADAYLNKPVDFKALAGLLRDASEGRTAFKAVA
ncbi:MAG: ATP-binding protein [Asticcacaulis sp.]